MNGLPEIVGRDEFAALIIRTDYEDEVPAGGSTTSASSA